MRHLGADALPAAVLLRFVKFVQFHRNVARPSYRMCLFLAVPRIRPIECVQFPTVPRVHLIESFNVLAMPRALFIECTFFFAAVLRISLRWNVPTRQKSKARCGQSADI